MRMQQRGGEGWGGGGREGETATLRQKKRCRRGRQKVTVREGERKKRGGREGRIKGGRKGGRRDTFSRVVGGVTYPLRPLAILAREKKLRENINNESYLPLSRSLSLFSLPAGGRAGERRARDFTRPNHDARVVFVIPPNRSKRGC